MIGPPKRRSEILALAITPDAKGPALRLAQAPRKLSLSFCPRGAPQRVAKRRIVNIDHSG